MLLLTIRHETDLLANYGAQPILKKGMRLKPHCAAHYRNLTQPNTFVKLFFDVFALIFKIFKLILKRAPYFLACHLYKIKLCHVYYRCFHRIGLYRLLKML